MLQSISLLLTPIKLILSNSALDFQDPFVSNELHILSSVALPTEGLVGTAAGVKVFVCILCVL